MEAERSRYDDMNESDLHRELKMRDWNVGLTAYSTYGVQLTLRKHYTSDAPGVETRQVDGEDEADAYRKFLKLLDSESAG